MPFVNIYSIAHEKHVRSHSVRVSYVTDLYEASQDIRKAKELVGHKTIQFTELYIHSALDEKERLNLQKNLLTYRLSSASDSECELVPSELLASSAEDT